MAGVEQRTQPVVRACRFHYRQTRQDGSGTRAQHKTGRPLFTQVLNATTACYLRKNMSQTNLKPWPLSVAHTTGVENHGLLHALLAVSTFDEISNADDFTAVREYARSQGKAGDSGKTTVGLVFWVYPTGLYGPYHETEDHQIKQHGVLLTVEPGVSVEEVVRGARAGLKDDVIAHEHIGTA